MAKFRDSELSAQRPMYLASAKSRNAQFKPSICNDCNSAKTQSHDFAYSVFSNRISELMAKKLPPQSIAMELPWSNPFEETSRDCLKYFAKLIGCHCAEVDAPIPKRLSEFVTQRTLFSLVRCEITEAVGWKAGFKHFEEIEEDIGHVAHMGLAVMFDPETNMPKSYRSGIRLKWTDLHFFFDFSAEEIIELTAAHGDFLSLARANFRRD